MDGRDSLPRPILFTLTMQFDTLKIAFPTLYIKREESKFIEDTDRKGKTVYLLKQCEKQHVGLTSLRVGNTETVAEFSAKILKEKYPDLLSAETIVQALNNLKGFGFFLEFDTDEIVNIAHVLKAHPARHVRPAADFATCAKLLTDLHTNTHYTPTNYKNETVTFTQNVSTTKNREYLKFYNKETEYNLSKNTGYRETLTAQQKPAVAARFQGVAKVETELNSKRKLRQYYPGIAPEIWLKDLLYSSRS